MGGARGSFRGGFNPQSVTAIPTWLRLAASTPVSGEYETVVDVLAANNATQTGAVRKPAAAASANGLPVATFDGSDVWAWPIAASNHSTDKWELLLWLKAGDLAAAQRVFACDTSGGATLNRIRVTLVSTGAVEVLVFISNGNGRTFATPAGVFTAGAWVFLHVKYDSQATNEADTDGLTVDAKVRVFTGGTARALTATDVGAGGTIGALRTATGNNLLGAASDSDTPVSPLRNGAQTGPNIWVANAAVTAVQAASLQNFEAPT